MIKLTGVILFCIWGMIALAQEYKYRILDSQGETEWTIQAPVKSGKKITAEESFNQIKIKKKLMNSRSNMIHAKSIALVGDTGCRLKESALKSTYQDCNDPKQWRYPEVINSLAQEKPDIIIHLGDYHYREQCSPGKACQKMSPEIGYAWGPWNLDFFAPTKKAFAVAPLIIVRGNHEDCQRAHLGYFKLLTNSKNAQCEDYEDSQVIVVGDLAIINLDSSSIGDMPDISTTAADQWKTRMNLIGEKLKSVHAKHIWLVSHKPVYGLVPFGKAYAPLNINLRKYFEAAPWAKRVELIFAGHIHSSEVVSAKDFPLQIVIGNGGTALDPSMAEATTENLSAVGYEKAKIISHEFGYVLIKDIETENARIEFHDSAGVTTFTCHLKDKGKDCL